MNLKDKLKKLEEKKNSLEKKDLDLIITDFDDTIFCRKEQLEDSKLLKENRGDAGNKVILEKIGIKNFIKKYYKNKDYPKDISSKLKTGIDVIITAGEVKIQKNKLLHTGLINHNYIVVKKSEDKIFETINYVVNTLKFIPKKIIVYEDRPNYFIENKKLIEDFLEIKLEIMFVKMENNYKKVKIKKIED